MIKLLIGLKSWLDWRVPSKARNAAWRKLEMEDRITYKNKTNAGLAWDSNNNKWTGADQWQSETL